MKKSVMGLLFISLTLSLSSCGVNSDKSPLAFGTAGGATPAVNPIKVDTNKENDPQFASLQKNFFLVSCMKCHSAEQTRHINLTSKEVVLKNFDEIIRKVSSPFVPLNAKDGPMPPKASSVSPEVIASLKAWKSNIQFAEIQKNLIETSCIKCHSATQTRHSNLTSKEEVLKNFDEIIRRTADPFVPESANDKPMPPKGPTVSRELIKQLQDWKSSL